MIRSGRRVAELPEGGLPSVRVAPPLTGISFDLSLNVNNDLPIWPIIERRAIGHQSRELDGFHLEALQRTGKTPCQPSITNLRNRCNPGLVCLGGRSSG